MKANFGRNDKKSNNVITSDLIEGGFEQMIKTREENLPEVEKTINKVLNDYDGGMIAIVRVIDDENGDPEAQQVFIGGVSHLGSQVKLAKGLNQAMDALRDSLLESCKGNPKAMKALLKELTNELMERIEEK